MKIYLNQLLANFQNYVSSENGKNTLHIDDLHIQQSLGDVENIDITDSYNEIIFSNCIFEVDVTISSSCNIVSIDRCNFRYDLYFYETKVKDKIVFDKSNFVDIYFTKVTEEPKLIFRDGNLSKISFTSNSSFSEFDFMGSSKANNEIGELDIPDTTFSNFFVTRFYIQTIKFYRNFYTSQANIIQCNINTIYFDNFSLNNSLNLFGIKSFSDNPSIKIIGSNLSGINFSNCDFTDFQLSMAYSDITGVQITDVLFPKEINIPEDQKREDGKYLEAYRLKENYKQFKILMNRNQDKIQEIHYGAKEKDSYLNYLNNKPKTNRSEFADQVALLFSKIISDYGQNWMRAFWCYLGFGIISFMILCLIEGQIFENPILNLFKFMNPAHGFDFIETKNSSYILNWGGVLWDTVSRIVLSLILYQLIISFRKLSRI